MSGGGEGSEGLNELHRLASDFVIVVFSALYIHVHIYDIRYTIYDIV